MFTPKKLKPKKLLKMYCDRWWQKIVRCVTLSLIRLTPSSGITLSNVMVMVCVDVNYLIDGNVVVDANYLIDGTVVVDANQLIDGTVVTYSGGFPKNKYLFF